MKQQLSITNNDQLEKDIDDANEIKKRQKTCRQINP